MGLILSLNGRQAEEAIFEVQQIIFAHLGECRIRKAREVMLPLWSYPLLHGTNEVFITPRANSCSSIWSDFVSIKDFKWGRKWAALSQKRTSALYISVVAATTSRMKNLLSSNRIWSACLGAGKNQQRNQATRAKQPMLQLQARQLSWQFLQAPPTASIALPIAFISPDWETVTSSPLASIMRWEACLKPFRSVQMLSKAPVSLKPDLSGNIVGMIFAAFQIATA